MYFLSRHWSGCHYIAMIIIILTGDVEFSWIHRFDIHCRLSRVIECTRLDKRTESRLRQDGATKWWFIFMWTLNNLPKILSKRLNMIYLYDLSMVSISKKQQFDQCLFYRCALRALFRKSWPDVLRLTLAAFPVASQQKGGARRESLLTADDAMGKTYLFICFYLRGLDLPQ